MSYRVSLFISCLCLFLPSVLRIYIESLLDFYEILKRKKEASIGWPGRKYACQRRREVWVLSLCLMSPEPYFLKFGGTLEQKNPCCQTLSRINIIGGLDLNWLARMGVPNMETYAYNKGLF